MVVPAAADQTPPAAPNADVTATPVEAPVSGETTPETETKELKTFKQEEVDDIVSKRLAKQERKLQRDADRRIAEAVAKATPPAPIQQVQDKPTADKFNTTEDYVEALADWKYEQKKTQERQTQQQRQIQEYTSGIDSRYSEVIETGSDTYDDFQDAFMALGKLPIPDNVALGLKEAIAQSDNGHELLYYLGKNTDEALRIAKLSPIAAAREIGKLEAKIAATPPVTKTSSAPPPINPVKPAGGLPVLDTSDSRSLKQLGTSGWIEAERSRQRREWEQRHR
jgi:hypothetical protein